MKRLAIALRSCFFKAFDWLSVYVYGIISAMNSSVRSVLRNANLILPDWVQAQLATLQTQITERDTRLAEKDAELKRRELKIQQLTLELAHHKRFRFGHTSEAFSASI